MHRHLIALNTRVAAACAEDIASFCREEDMTQEEVTVDLLRLKPQTLSGYLNNYRQVPAVLPLLIQRKLEKDTALRVMAELGHGEYTSKATPKGVTNATLISGVGKVSKEFGEAVDKLTADLADGRLDDVEGTLSEIRDLVVAVGDLMRDVAAMGEVKDARYARHLTLRDTEPEFAAATSKGAA